MDRAAREQVGSALRWLGARAERRLVEIVVSPESRQETLALVALSEHEGALPHVVLEAPWTKADGGFELRADELALRRNELDSVAAAEGVVLRERTSFAKAAGGAGSARFLRELGDLLDALPRALEGLVVVLAPVFVADAHEMREAVSVFVGSAMLTRARWVVVAHAPALGDLTARLGDRVAHTVDAVGDGPGRAARLADDLDRAAGATSETSGTARVGAASPRVSPPARRAWTTPDALRPECHALLPHPGTQAATAEITDEPTLFEQVRTLVLRASAACARGNFTLALPPLRDARDLCFLHGRNEDGIRVELMLGSFVAAAGAREQAIQIYGAACARAHEAELPALACQAELARASAFAALPDLPRAAAAFADAGHAAERASLPLLALEGYRLAGEAALAAGLEPQAAEAWARALRVAGEDVEPSLSPTTAEIATRLALVCDAHGLTAQAASLRARSDLLRKAALPRDESAPSAGAAAAQTESAPRLLSFTPAPQGATPPSTPGFREVFIADVPRNRVPSDLRGTVRLMGDTPPTAEEDR